MTTCPEIDDTTTQTGSAISQTPEEIALLGLQMGDGSPDDEDCEPCGATDPVPDPPGPH